MSKKNADSWIFESRDDGAIFFYPHGWGRAYVVPTEEKRREIERSLTLWRERLHRTSRVSFWLCLSAAVISLTAVTPPFCRVGWYVPRWLTLVRWTEHLGLASLLGMSSPLLLRFLAETAKADLEKSEMRCPYAESLSHRSWRTLWLEEACYSCILFVGLWLLWPRRYSVMLPERTMPAFLPGGLALTTIGGIMTVAKLWQMRAKRRFERGPS